MAAQPRIRFCRCGSTSSPTPADGRLLCPDCGDPVPDPMLLLVARQNRKLIEQQQAMLERLNQLEGTRGDPPEDEQRIEEETSDPELLDPAELARRLGVSRKFVYRHASELGAIRPGDGPQPRLYFRLEEARQRLAARSNGSKPREPAKPPRRSRKRRSSTDVSLLEIKEP